MKTAALIRFQVSWLNVLGSNVVLSYVWKNRTPLDFKSQELQERSRNGMVEQALNPQHQTYGNIKSCGIYTGLFISPWNILKIRNK